MLYFRLLAIFSLLCGLLTNSVARRLGGGYLEPIDTDDPEVVSAATWAANKLKGTLVKITSANEQIVAGWMYHISIHIKSEQKKDMQCRVKVWVRHWLNRMQLVSAACRPTHA
ncbi:cystatin-like [Ruditapes philippinarum]|uniref:cystatin-like n=1 Tax=Ruditapes philippinarum TaxID=129788 RepID=UPI00295B3A37|nr:cystatin-like [Ruditapes philippinarum]